jgi:hypothetical protein
VAIPSNSWHIGATHERGLDSIKGWIHNLGISLWEDEHMTGITWISLSLLRAIFTMMVAAEVGQHRGRARAHRIERVSRYSCRSIEAEDVIDCCRRFMSVILRIADLHQTSCDFREVP